jgi:hypothetical protein
MAAAVTPQNQADIRQGRSEAGEPKSPWISAAESLPPFNTEVAAYLVGVKAHSGVTWKREGRALMVRWNDPKSSDAHGWADPFVSAALKKLDADALRVTHWIALHAPEISPPPPRSTP